MITLLGFKNNVNKAKNLLTKGYIKHPRSSKICTLQNSINEVKSRVPQYSI